VENKKHTVLCLDDEQNILSSLKRLLRREDYTLLTTSSGEDALALLGENDIQLVMADQRMPGMSGTEFFASVKDRYPDVIRIILTGYTEVDAITESINRGHIYKFFLKPWNDENLKLEIQKALEQYDLIQANKMLNEKILRQNDKLQRVNDDLEKKVFERTRELELRNQALELSRAVLDQMPCAVIGMDTEGVVVLANQKAFSMSFQKRSIVLGENLSEYFSDEIEKKVQSVVKEGTGHTIKEYKLEEGIFDIDLSLLSEKFHGNGVIMSINQSSASKIRPN